MNELTHRWIREVLGAHDVRDVWTLTFGISSDMRLIEVDGTQMVLRRYVNESVNELPMAIAREAQALKAAGAVLGGLVPEPIAHDVTGARAGCPSLIMTYLPGVPVIHNLDLRQTVGPLTLLHARVAPRDFPTYRHWFDSDRLAVPEWTQRPATWAELIEAVGAGEPKAEHVFLHRDYHPGNLLWQHGRLSGIVGLAVVMPRATRNRRGSRARNLALVDGVDAAEQFLRAYHEVDPPTITILVGHCRSTLVLTTSSTVSWHSMRSERACPSISFTRGLTNGLVALAKAI